MSEDLKIAEDAIAAKDKAEAACAETREALVKLFVHANEFSQDFQKCDFDLCDLARLDMQSMEVQFPFAERALSLTCGTGYVHVDQLVKLIELLRSLSDRIGHKPNCEMVASRRRRSGRISNACTCDCETLKLSAFALITKLQTLQGKV